MSTVSVRADDGDGDDPAKDTVSDRAEDADEQAPAEADEVRTTRSSLPHRPALDGLRGLAVAAVVLYHGAAANGVGWLEPVTRGGYLGVSAFFTLSGFLIASLLLEERRSSGTVGIRRFWERRARRLLPASLLTIAAVALLTPVLGTEAQLASLPGDAWASLFYVANWRFIVQGADYAALFVGDPSPLRHIWSLAVEEQWYVFVPLAAVAGSWFVSHRGGNRLWLVRALVVACIVATAWMVVISGGQWDNRAYMGTDTRLAEMAIGALAASIIRPGLRVPGRLARFAVGVGPFALVAVLVTWALTAIDSAWLYRGGLSVHALLVAVIVLAAVVPLGLTQRLLSGGALARLGRISYAVYLFHWPIIWWVTPERLGVGPTAALALQIILTLLAAGASLRLLERPIRSRSALVGRRAPLALLAVLALVALLIATIPAPDRSAVVALGSGQTVAIPTTTLPPEPTANASGTVPTTTLPPEPMRVMVVGDSFAESLLIGMQRWGLTSGSAAVMDATIPACAFGRGGVNRGVGIWRRESDECEARDATLLTGVAEFDPDIVVIAGGMWDITDRKPSGFRRWTRIGREEYDAFLRGELHHLVDVAASGGARVLWANSPHWDPIPGSVIFMGHPPYAEADPTRTDAFNALLASVVAERPEAELLDVAGWMNSQPGGEFEPALRPDGVHFSEESTDRVAQWLGPLLLVGFDA